mgnify:CR=1 FL=1
MFAPAASRPFRRFQPLTLSLGMFALGAVPEAWSLDDYEYPHAHEPIGTVEQIYEGTMLPDLAVSTYRNIDRLFAYPEFSAAPNVYEGLADFHRLNSGVFTAKPSKATFDAMMQRLDQPDVFWRRTDQTFLQDFFPGWHGLPVFDNMLQYVWFNLPELWDWKSVHVVHYQYEKPWQDDHPKRAQLQPLIDLWQSFRSGESIPDIDTLPNPAAAQ